MLTVIKHANGKYSWTADAEGRYHLKNQIYFNLGTDASCPHCGQGLEDEDITIHNVIEVDDTFELLVGIPRQYLVGGSVVIVTLHKNDMKYKEEKAEESKEETEDSEESTVDSHYKALAIEPLEVMRGMMTKTEYKGFLKGNIIKYSIRQGNKKGESAEKDAAKCREYIRLLNELENPDIPY